MLSQGDPAFGRQQRSTVGGFSDWLLHKVLRFQVPCLPLPHTVEVLAYLRNIHSFGKRINTLLVIVSQEKMHFIQQNSWLPFVAGIGSPCPCSSPSRSCAGVVITEFGPSLCVPKWDRQPRSQGSPRPGKQGQGAEHSTLLLQLASGWPGELTQRGRSLRPASPSYPLVNVRRAQLLLSFYRPHTMQNLF